jgi:serine/threonine protein kinase
MTIHSCIHFIETLRINYNQLKLEELLGHGTFGSVIKAKWNTGYSTRNRDVAVKFIPISNIEKIKNEAIIHLSL